MDREHAVSGVKDFVSHAGEHRTSNIQCGQAGAADPAGAGLLIRFHQHPSGCSRLFALGMAATFAYNASPDDCSTIKHFPLPGGKRTGNLPARRRGRCPCPGHRESRSVVRPMGSSRFAGCRRRDRQRRRRRVSARLRLREPRAPHPHHPKNAF